MYILVWNNQFDIDLCVTFAVYPTKESPGKDDSTTDDEYFGDPLNVADNGSWAEWQQQFHQHPDTDSRLGELGHHQHVHHLNDQVALNSDLSSCTGLWRIWSLSCLTHVIHVHMSYMHAFYMPPYTSQIGDKAKIKLHMILLPLSLPPGAAKPARRSPQAASAMLSPSTLSPQNAGGVKYKPQFLSKFYLEM